MKALKSVLLIFLLLFSGTSGYAVTLNFEDLPDSVSVANFYAPEGVFFTEAISLTKYGDTMSNDGSFWPFISAFVSVKDSGNIVWIAPTK